MMTDPLHTLKDPKADHYTITLDDDPMVHLIVEKVTNIPSRLYINPHVFAKELEHLNPKAVFIDINLGDALTSGLDLVPLIRKQLPYCPILIVTSTPAEQAIAKALASGADDFVRKPIIPEELLARLKLRLEEAAQRSTKETVAFGNITIDLVHRSITGPLGQRYASPIEITLLSMLATNEGHTVDKETLKLRCWGEIKVTDNALHRKLHAARALLRDVSENVLIQTKYGVGFELKFFAPGKLTDQESIQNVG